MLAGFITGKPQAFGLWMGWTLRASGSTELTIRRTSQESIGMAFGFQPQIVGLFALPRSMEPRIDIGFSEKVFQPIRKFATLFPWPP
jgi:hypothetical protein